MNREHCLQQAAARFDSGRFQQDLAARVACRTESDGTPDLAVLADYLKHHIEPALQRLGFECRIVPNARAGAPPLLIGRRTEDPRALTLLGYGHGDVVNGQADRWREGLSPWELHIEGERWYGRGTADNKGQHSINIAALGAAIAARGGRLGFNVTMLIEMGEEAGSPGLAQTCAAHADALRADLLLACDGPRNSAARPTFFTGSRGAVNFALKLQCRERAYHSGNWGGVLANPATVLAHALASLVDAHGRLRVEGLLPPPLTPELRAALAPLRVGEDADAPALDAGWGEPGLSAAERLFGWNTLEVLALGAGSPQRPVNAIPPSAVAHCQLRFVVGTAWQDLQACLRQHLDAHGFAAVQVEVQGACAATRLAPTDPWVAWCSASIQRSSGQQPHYLPNLAGTLPNDIFADQLGLPTLWVPHSHPACNQHAPNEHLLGPLAREGLQIMAGLYWDLGEPPGSEQAAPWPGA